MNDNHMYLSDLNTSSKNYTVRVTVIEKTRPKNWPRNGVAYQNLLFADEKGNKMRGILFGEQIGLYREALMYNGRYEISNAPIKKSHSIQETDPAERKYIMVFNRLTDIQPLDIRSISNYRNYQEICQIPRTFNTSDRYDIVAIVLFVEEKPHTISTPQGKDYTVRELVVQDHSTAKPLLIAAWHDLAYAECDFLRSRASNLQMVGFTALKTSNHKGFSMTTTMSTTFIRSPTGDKPRTLAHWRNQNRNDLTTMQERIVAGRRSFPNKFRSTIAALQTKNVYNLSQDDKYILQVKIPYPSLENVNAYIGCSECNCATDTQAGDSYYCINCSTDNVIPLPRITFNCQVTDGTGNLAITAFTTDAEKILQMQAADIFRMKHTEDNATFELLKTRLQTSQMMIVVAPTTHPTIMNNVQWKLDSIELTCKQHDTKKTPETSSKTEEPTEEKVPGKRTAQTTEDMKYDDSTIQITKEANKQPGTHNTPTSTPDNTSVTQITSPPHISETAP